MKKGICAVALLLVAHAQSASADSINLCFESGDFSGWELSEIYMGVSQYTPIRGLMPAGSQNVTALAPATSALEGTYFASIGTGHAYYLPGQGPFDIYAMQTLSMEAGEALSGWSAFYDGDFGPQDSAYVRILDSTGSVVATPWHRISGAFQTSTPWTEWTWTPTTSGQYTLALGATSFGDNSFDSYGFHDAIRTPEPSAFLLLSGGIAALIGGGRLRRRRTVP